MLKLSKYASLMLLLPLSAFAQDKIDVLFVQVQLEQHGFDIGGNPDGVLGPKTRSALSAYAKKYAVSDDFSSVLSEMARRNIENRIPISDEKMRKGIEDTVAEQLNDPFSAKFRNIYKISQADGTVLICGEVNGKNLYGAYVGFRFFYGLSSGFSPIMLLKIDGDSAISENACLLSHPR